MERDERAVVDPSEGNTEQGGEAVAGAEERVSGAENNVHGAASESAKKQDLEQGPLPEPSEAAAAPGSAEKEDCEAFENPIAIANPLEFRSAAAEATPQSASLRARSRRRNQAVLMGFTAAGDAEPDGSRASVLGASASSAPATGTLEDIDGERGSAPGDDKMLKRVCSAPGATVEIAHASPPDSYRRVPSRRRKQYSPKRFIAVAGALSAAAVLSEGHPPPPAASLGYALPSASGFRTVGSGVIDGSASTSSSNRLPSRGRKQPRPEHFISEEAEATASAKAGRSGIVLDRFLSSLIHGSSATDSEWPSNVTAEDSAVRGGRQRGGECFSIRDVGSHAARGIQSALRLSRLGASCGGRCSSVSSATSGSPPGEPDGRGRFYGVLAVLGASLALSVVSCVLFYIVGQRGEPGPSLEKQNE